MNAAKNGPEKEIWRELSNLEVVVLGAGKRKVFWLGHGLKGPISLSKKYSISYLWCRQTHSFEETFFDMQRPDGSTISSATLTDFNNFSGRSACFIMSETK